MLSTLRLFPSLMCGRENNKAHIEAHASFFVLANARHEGAVERKIRENRLLNFPASHHAAEELGHRKTAHSAASPKNGTIFPSPRFLRAEALVLHTNLLLMFASGCERARASCIG